ncbi:MAG: ATP-dependent Clp protease adaptor ClpS [Planctomycetes bacterium]|nr:ATP-dependent Clp protease adaptor ClpS [Planctomycetota bacterium]
MPPTPGRTTALPRPETDAEPRLAPMWRVLLHNDDVTPMEFVVKVLREIFKLNAIASIKLMLEAHFSGVALVVVETREQAEFHIDQAHSMARPRGYPLTFSMEPEE